ncbi:hypothetical protein B0H17DRAFT_940191 [Mycena rosella]|uniref:Transposase n=1 Tax=Mycena rosella TaxID=1033263 RepID=A0AAD7GBK2_MYCRO|nr:hypothetical protein B0H17DRAFT_940191 [Mycena rosella]
MLSDEDVAGDIHLHLQSLGKWVSAKDIVKYVHTPEFQARLRAKQNISECTARRWMKKMGYRWKKEPTGMYSDGHEREDVVNYRQNVFLPRWRALTVDGDGRIVVIWRHDESTFYAHDQWKVRWVRKGEKPSIKPKGEGESQMVGDFVSPDYGWLKGKQLKADGYNFLLLLK